MSKKNKKDKRSFWGKVKWTIVLIVILFISLVASAMFFEKEIGELAIQSVKDQLKTEVEKFTAQQEFQREQFNTQNATAIAQSNVEWRRKANTADTAAFNATFVPAARPFMLKQPCPERN